MLVAMDGNRLSLVALLSIWRKTGGVSSVRATLRGVSDQSEPVSGHPDPLSAPGRAEVTPLEESAGAAGLEIVPVGRWPHPALV